MIDPAALHPAWSAAWRRGRACAVLAAALMTLFAFAGAVTVGAGPVPGSQERMAEAARFSATPPAGSVAELVWVSEGEPDFPLQKPNAVTADPQGNLWVTDGAHDRFVIFSPRRRRAGGVGNAGQRRG